MSSGGEKQTLVLEDDMTVGEVRGLIGAMLDLPESSTVAMTYVGRQLNDDELTWGDAVRAVEASSSSFKAKPPTSAANGATSPPQPPQPVRKVFCRVTSRAPTSDVSAEALRAALASKERTAAEEKAEREQARRMEPMIDALASSPEFVDRMLDMQPGLKKMIEEHPEVGRDLRNPEVIKAMMMSQIDPDRRREMNRSLELQMAHIAAIPGGQQLLDRHMSGMLASLDADGTRTEADLHAASEEHARPTPGKSVNSEALPNPWASSSPALPSGPPPLPPMPGFSPFGPMMGAGRGGGHAATGAAPPPALGGGLYGQSPAAAFAQLFGGNAGTPFGYGGSGNGGGLPMMPPANAMSSSAGAAPVGGSLAPATTADYSSQLVTLREMGFDNEALCKEALAACNGDVEDAVVYIAERQDS